jgi:hypothetical protein
MEFPNMHSPYVIKETGCSNSMLSEIKVLRKI